MKPLLTFLLTTILCFMAQELQTFDVLVTKVQDDQVTIVLDSRNPQCAASDQRPSCDYDTLDILPADWPASWPKPEKGVLFRATWIDNKVRFVAACPGRASRILDSPSYDKRGLNVMRDPDGCDRPASRFIRELLEKVKK